MFICEKCGKQSRAGQSSKRVVIAERPIEFPFREDAHGFDRHDPGGKGTQIAQELTVGPCCDPSLEAPLYTQRELDAFLASATAPAQA